MVTLPQQIKGTYVIEDTDALHFSPIFLGGHRGDELRCVVDEPPDIPARNSRHHRRVDAAVQKPVKVCLRHIVHLALARPHHVVRRQGLAMADYISIWQVFLLR